MVCEKLVWPAWHVESWWGMPMQAHHTAAGHQAFMQCGGICHAGPHCPLAPPPCHSPPCRCNHHLHGTGSSCKHGMHRGATMCWWHGACGAHQDGVHHRIRTACSRHECACVCGVWGAPDAGSSANGMMKPLVFTISSLTYALSAARGNRAGAQNERGRG